MLVMILKGLLNKRLIWNFWNLWIVINNNGVINNIVINSYK